MTNEATATPAPETTATTTETPATEAPKTAKGPDPEVVKALLARRSGTPQSGTTAAEEKPTEDEKPEPETKPEGDSKLARAMSTALKAQEKAKREREEVAKERESLKEERARLQRIADAKAKGDYLGALKEVTTEEELDALYSALTTHFFPGGDAKEESEEEKLAKLVEKTLSQKEEARHQAEKAAQEKEAREFLTGVAESFAKVQDDYPYIADRGVDAQAIASFYIEFADANEGREPTSKDIFDHFESRYEAIAKAAAEKKAAKAKPAPTAAPASTPTPKKVMGTRTINSSWTNDQGGAPAAKPKTLAERRAEVMRKHGLAK